MHQTFSLEQFFNGKLCCKIHDFLSVLIIFFWIGLLGAMDEFVYVFDAWRKWSCRVVCVWLRTNSDTIVSMLI